MTSSRAQSLLMGGVALGALSMVAIAILASGTHAGAPDQIAFAATLGAMMAGTAIAWWRGVRRSAMSTWMAVAALGWGVLVARAWVPNAPLRTLVAVGGMAELATVGWLAARVGRMVLARARDKRPSGSR